MSNNDKVYTGSSLEENEILPNGLFIANTVADQFTTLEDCINEIREEINIMKKDFDELRADCVPESTRRIRAIMREMEFYKDEDDPDKKELPTLKTSDPEFEMEEDDDSSNDLDLDLDDIGEIPFHPENYNGEFDE